MAEYTKNTPGAPTSGLYSVGDVVTDSTGVRWQAFLGGPGGAERFVAIDFPQQVTPTPTSVNTAGNLTITAAMLLTGLIVRDPSGAGRTDTLDTAANIVAALKNPKVGQEIRCLIVNGADAAETITLAAGSGGAFDANQVTTSRSIGQNVSKEIRIRITGVSSPAYVVYA